MLLTPFVLSITLSLAFDIDLAVTDASELSNTVWLAANLLIILVTAIGTLVYFKPKEIKPTLEIGMKFGLLIILFGIVSTILAFIPYNSGLKIFGSYFSQPFFWSAFLSVFLTSSLIGYMKSHSESRVNEMS